MKIVYLITGSGGSFYCGNCYRDMLFFRAIKKVPGISAAAIPLYLPPDEHSVSNGMDDHVFFGAISMYLREKVPMFRNMPSYMDRIFNAGPLLKIASHQAGATRTEGLEDLTLNMIEGDNAFRKDEADRLVSYLVKDGKPDIIHLSNALILGLARQIKSRINVKIVCSLLNEDDWIDEMAEPYRSEAWKLIAQEAHYVDSFITPSTYYRNLFTGRTGLQGDNIHILPLGIETFDPVAELKASGHALGYFCRISYLNGFDKLTDAFIRLKSEKFPDLSLHVCGGYTGDDKSFISGQIRKIREHGFKSSVKIYPEFQGEKKAEFFRNVDVISVPVRKYDGYGMYILESNIAGIPVVQPATGAFPEIIDATKGGIVYSPDTTEALASAIESIIDNSDLKKELGSNGRDGVLNKLSLERMSKGLSEIYQI